MRKIVLRTHLQRRYDRKGDYWDLQASEKCTSALVKFGSYSQNSCLIIALPDHRGPAASGSGNLLEIKANIKNERVRLIHISTKKIVNLDFREILWVFQWSSSMKLQAKLKAIKKTKRRILIASIEFHPSSSSRTTFFAGLVLIFTHSFLFGFMM
jgi:hypothetical protein